MVALATPVERMWHRMESQGVVGRYTMCVVNGDQTHVHLESYVAQGSLLPIIHLGFHCRRRPGCEYGHDFGPFLWSAHLIGDLS